MLAEEAFSATYIPAYIQPPGINATCHLHPEPMGFKTIEELQEHWHEKHERKQ